jgi:vacuolar-type H+-ATPase subunit I/STV1
MSQKDLIRELKETISDLTKEKNDAIKLASDKDLKIKKLLVQLELTNSDIKSMGSKIAELEDKLKRKRKKTLDNTEELSNDNNEKKDETNVDIKE